MRRRQGRTTLAEPLVAGPPNRIYRRKMKLDGGNAAFRRVRANGKIRKVGRKIGKE